MPMLFDTFQDVSEDWLNSPRTTNGKHWTATASACKEDSKQKESYKRLG